MKSNEEKRTTNCWYALYDGNDEYVSGADKLKELSVNYLGYDKKSLYHKKSLSNTDNVINRFFNEEEKVFECSKKIIIYNDTIVDKKGNNLGQNCSIYKFWEVPIQSKNKRNKKNEKKG